MRYGAPKNIIYESMPHIGTDNLRNVIKNMRLDMEQRGASFYFNTKLNEIAFEDDGVLAITSSMTFKTRHLILGLGHSARDTFKMLYKHDVKMEPKSFSMGVRIEHKREFINKMQYGNFLLIFQLLPIKVLFIYQLEEVFTHFVCAQEAR